MPYPRAGTIFARVLVYLGDATQGLEDDGYTAPPELMQRGIAEAFGKPSKVHGPAGRLLNPLIEAGLLKPPVFRHPDPDDRTFPTALGRLKKPKMLAYMDLTDAGWRRYRELKTVAEEEQIIRATCPPYKLPGVDA